MTDKHKILNNENIINFVAGLLGGFISVTICNPLDIARTRLNILVILHSCRHLLLIEAIVQSIHIFRML